MTPLPSPQQETTMHTTPVRFAAIGIAAALSLPLLAAPVAAQMINMSPAGSGLRTLQQMQQEYPQLGARQIEICDRNGDGLFDRGERACVNSIGSAMRDGR
jgi:hypothetical protein